jgi:DNA polymerase-3 subunit delta
MFYILHGEDTLSRDETLDRLLSGLGDPQIVSLNTLEFSGAVSLPSLRQACEALPFLGQARIAIVRDLFAAKLGKAYLQELYDYLPQLPESARLIFLEAHTLPSNHTAVQLAKREANGFVLDFPQLKDGKLANWIRQRVAEKGGAITPDALRMLAASGGDNLYVLDNELEKLVIYKSGPLEAEPIEAEDVARLASGVAEASIFDLVDALGNRDPSRAALLFQMKINEGVDPFYLFTMFVRQFRLLIQVKELSDAGKSPPVIASELRLHPYVAGKLAQQARGFSMAEMERIFHALLDTDIQVKTGEADLLTALSLLAASV